jgi:formylglycine-generating enzyme required for sulfatase activity
VTNQAKPRIFLCHAKEDKPHVIELYHQLEEAGYNPWLDKYDLLVGQDWWTEIEKIISDPYNLVVVCLSRQSIDKRGVVQREITRALDVLDDMPEDTIYLMPARLELCDVPRRLSRLQWVDLFEEDGLEYLKRSLGLEISKRLAPLEPELILIPAGEFLMGSDPEEVDRLLAQNPDAKREWFEGEQPQHTVYLPDYYIAKTPVTNAQYLDFVQATLYKQPGHWPKILEPPPGKENHPVVEFTWHDAIAYCDWLAKATGKPYRLPSEAEWEKAARGTDGRIYPWGDEPPDETRCNFNENVKDTTSVGQYSPQGDSPYGCMDMAGNVWEWTRSLWGTDWEKPDFKYPYDPEDGREVLEAGDDILRVLRGGAFRGIERGVRCAFRDWDVPFGRDWYGGFRVVVAPGL